jgi:hypothetical protein
VSDFTAWVSHISLRDLPIHIECVRELIDLTIGERLFEDATEPKPSGKKKRLTELSVRTSVSSMPRPVMRFATGVAPLSSWTTLNPS